MMPIIVATRSAHKLREIRQILGDLPAVQVQDLDDAGVPVDPLEEGIEVFDTFMANAVAKARYFAARTAGIVVADDSGLCVDALGGAPGVLSKRFSGRLDLDGDELDLENNRLLLDRLEGVPLNDRAAHYVCAVAVIDPSGTEMVFEGTCDGSILDVPRGDGGFGYDPLFLVAGEDATFAELPPHRKNQISHRARAIRTAARAIMGRMDEPDDGAGESPPTTDASSG